MQIDEEDVQAVRDVRDLAQEIKATAENRDGEPVFSPAKMDTLIVQLDGLYKAVSLIHANNDVQLGDSHRSESAGASGAADKLDEEGADER